MSDLNTTIIDMFLKQHGLLPDQATERIAALASQLNTQRNDREAMKADWAEKMDELHQRIDALVDAGVQKDAYCTHTRVKVGAYTDRWETDCGRAYGITGPMEVGMGFNSNPTGKYCSNCGKKLKVDRWSKIQEQNDEY